MKKVRQIVCGAVMGCVLLSSLALGQDGGNAPRAGRRGEQKNDEKKDNGDRAGRRPRQWRPEDIQRMREQMQKRRMELMRNQLGVKSDEEWEIIRPRIEAVQKLVDAKRRVETAATLAIMSGGRDRGGRAVFMGGMMGTEKLPEVGARAEEDGKALGKLATDEKATEMEVSAKLADYRKAMKALDEALAAARAKLREILAPKQEAVLVLYGLLQ